MPLQVSGSAIVETPLSALGVPASADTLALAAPGRAPLTHGELRCQIGVVRSALADAGAGTGRVVAVAIPSGPELIAAFLGISQGGACAPLAATLTEPEYRSTLARLGAQALICEEGTPAEAAARSLGVQVLTLRSQASDPAGGFSLFPTSSNTKPGRTTEAALLLLTSATTGRPKLVPITRANLDAASLHDARALELTAGDRFLSLMPLYHLHGISAALTQLLCGGTVIATAGFDPGAFLGWLAEFRPTWFSASPAIHRIIVTLAREHPEVFRSVRFIRSTGAGLDPALLVELEEVTGIPVLEGYGMTEAGSVARSTLAFRKAGSVGRACAAEISIRDDSGKPLPRGSEGEIVVRGLSVVSGYLDDDEATQTAFRDGWFHTGDLGKVDENGFLFLRGRIKDMINRGGEKIIPEEIDRVFLAHPAVEDAAAFAIPHRTLGEDVVAAVVLRAGAAPTELELLRYGAAQLARFKLPRRIVFVDRIPRGPTGKAKRRVLAEQFAQCLPSREHAALDSTGERLAEIWRRVLGLEQVGAGDDFFLLGGDSLTAAVMLAQVCRTFELNTECFPALDFFEQPTLATLVSMVDAAQTGSGSGGCIALRTTGSRPPLFCFPANNRGPFYLRHLAQGLGSDRPVYAVCPDSPRAGLVSIEEAARLSVEAMRRVQPRGPYAIVGHCYGGVVAFEAARQIVLQGDLVGCLVLLDTPAPGYPKPLRHWRRYAAQAREAVAALVRGRRPFSAVDVATHLRMLGRRLRRKFAGRAAGVLSATRSGSLLAGRREKELNGLAMRGYALRGLAVPIVQINANDTPVSTRLLDDPRLGWRDFARAGFEVRRVPGDHHTMLRPPRAAAVANELKAILESLT